MLVFRIALLESNKIGLHILMNVYDYICYHFKSFFFSHLQSLKNTTIAKQKLQVYQVYLDKLQVYLDHYWVITG